MHKCFDALAYKGVILEFFFQRGSDLKFFLVIGAEKKNSLFQPIRT